MSIVVCAEVQVLNIGSTQTLTPRLLLLSLQVALFDRIHSIRVKHIQEEYQKYMERVRGKAQAAIDQARVFPACDNISCVLSALSVRLCNRADLPQRATSWCSAEPCRLVQRPQGSL